MNGRIEPEAREYLPELQMRFMVKADLESGVDYLVAASLYRLHQQIEYAAIIALIEHRKAVSTVMRSLGQRRRHIATRITA